MLKINIEDFESDSVKFLESTVTNYNKFVKRHALDLYNRILKKTPYRTGVLLDGWDIEFEYVEEFLNAEITNSVSYADYVEYGTEHFDGRLMMTLSVQEVERRMKRELEKNTNRRTK